MDNAVNYITGLLPPRFKKYIDSLPSQRREQIKEIRLRNQKPLTVDTGGVTMFANECAAVSMNDINAVMTLLSDHSMNSVKDKLSKGFITLSHGCRVGITGEVIIKNGEIDFQRNINSINIRIARECIGCSKRLFGEIYSGGNIHNTLIISPPMMGKTTMLRDIARNLGNLENITIIDERSEIAACMNGAAQFDVGKLTDILDGCPKPQGIALAVRSMSPRAVITDEIGSQADCDALIDAAKCGVSFIATMHAASTGDVMSRKCTSQLFSENIVKRVIRLGNMCGIGTVEEIIKY